MRRSYILVLYITAIIEIPRRDVCGDNPRYFRGYGVHVAVSDLGYRIIDSTRNVLFERFPSEIIISLIFLNNNLPSKRFKSPVFEIISGLSPRSDISRGFNITHPEFQRDIIVKVVITELYRSIAQKSIRGISRFMVERFYLPLYELAILLLYMICESTSHTISDSNLEDKSLDRLINLVNRFMIKRIYSPIY